jgi:hypothetical protein
MFVTLQRMDEFMTPNQLVSMLRDVEEDAYEVRVIYKMERLGLLNSRDNITLSPDHLGLALYDRMRQLSEIRSVRTKAFMKDKTGKPNWT